MTLVGILCALITAYIVVLFARAIMSWIPIRAGTPWASLYGLLLDLTEPLLVPLRRVMTPATVSWCQFQRPSSGDMPCFSCNGGCVVRPAK